MARPHFGQFNDGMWSTWKCNASWESQDGRSTARPWRRLSANPTRRSTETSSGCTGQSRPHFRQHHAMITAVPWMVVSAVTQPTAAQKIHRAGTENRSCRDTGIGSGEVTTRASQKTVRTIPYAQWVWTGGPDTVEFGTSAVLEARAGAPKPSAARTAEGASTTPKPPWCGASSSCRPKGSA